MATMASSETRSDVWQELLDAARLVRYYEALSDRHRIKHSIVRFLLLASAVGGIGALLDLLPDKAQLIAGALVALLVIWDFMADYAKKAAILHTISKECSDLEIKWQALWREVNRAESDDGEIRFQIEQLARRAREVTGRAGDADIRVDHKLNQKCAESAYKVTAERYAS